MRPPNQEEKTPLDQRFAAGYERYEMLGSLPQSENEDETKAQQRRIEQAILGLGLIIKGSP